MNRVNFMMQLRRGLAGLPPSEIEDIAFDYESYFTDGIADGRTEIPFRVKSRGPSFSNLSVLPAMAKNVMIADLIAIVGSIDFVLGEVDR